MSAFGGIVLFNKSIDANLAKVINKNFFEAIVAPRINKKTLKILKLKELSVAFTNISEDCVDDLVGKLTTKIEKLSLQELKSVNDV